MKLLGVSVALCAVLTLSRANPVANSSMEMMEMMEMKPMSSGICAEQNKYCKKVPGACCPMCDSNGDFEAKQCSKALGCCWCVETKTGYKIPGTETMAWTKLECEKEMYCPYGWYYYDKKCYMYVNDPKPWYEAEMYCQFYYGNLASVHSYEEYHFVQYLTKGHTHDFPLVWLGGHDGIYTGFWMWCDGTKFYHEYWCDEEHQEPGCCLKMNYGLEKKWAAGNCSHTLPFVCAKSIYHYPMGKDGH